jgi:hypothetical protein
MNADRLRVIALKGRRMIAQGNALGIQACHHDKLHRGVTSIAPIGLPNPINATVTQGVALGYHPSALQADRRPSAFISG